MSKCGAGLSDREWYRTAPRAAPARAAASEPTMVTTHADGTCRFRVYLPHAAKVELLGTFTDWREGRLAMTRQHPGWWELTCPVPAGEHQFCYLVDGSIWLADYAAHGVKLNGYGGWTSRLNIAAAEVAQDAQVAAAA